LHRADNAFAFFSPTITWFGLMSFKISTRPLGQRISSSSTFRFADAEVHAQIILRKIAAAAAHLIDLRVQICFAGRCVTHLMRAPMPLRFDFVPMVLILIQLFPVRESHRNN